MAIDNDNEIARARRAKRRRVIRRRAGVFLLAVFLFLAIIVGVSMYSTVMSYDIRDFFKNIVTFGSFPVKIETGTVTEEAVSAKSLFLLSDTTLKVVSGNGAELFEYSHGISSPGLSVSGNRAVVFSRGGKSFKVFNRTMLLYSGSLDNAIISAAVTQSGKTAILSAGEVYTCELAVYNRNCEKTFTWYGSDGFPIGVYPSSYGNEVLVMSVKSKNGALYTTVTRIDLNSKTEKSSFELEGLGVSAFPDSDSAVIFLDDRCVKCKYDGRVEATFSYEGRILMDVLSDPGKDLVVAFGDNKRSEINSVTVLTRKLVTAGVIDFREQIDDMWVSSDRVYILNRGKVSAYSHSGVLQEKYSCDFSTYSVVYFGGVLTFEPQYIVKMSRDNREVIE